MFLLYLENVSSVKRQSNYQFLKLITFHDVFDDIFDDFLVILMRHERILENNSRNLKQLKMILALCHFRKLYCL